MEGQSGHDCVIMMDHRDAIHMGSLNPESAFRGHSLELKGIWHSLSRATGAGDPGRIAVSEAQGSARVQIFALLTATRDAVLTASSLVVRDLRRPSFLQSRRGTKPRNVLWSDPLPSERLSNVDPFVDDALDRYSAGSNRM